MTRANETNKPVLLLGAYGRGNAGDDVFLYSAVSLFKDRIIYINSTDNSMLPPILRDKLETISTVSLFDIFKKLRVYWDIKEVVYWGGDLWVELLYGTRRPRQMLYKMVLLNILLRLSGKKVHYIGCGIGDLHGFSLWLARLSARMASKIVTREQRTARVLGLHNIRVLPDLAINSPYNTARLHTVDKPFILTISILQDIPLPHKNFPKLISQLARFLDTLPKRKFKIVLLSMHIDPAEPYDDLRASQQLKQLVKKHDVELFAPRDLESITRQLGNSHLIIGGRLHANILGILNSTPTIGIAYRPKVRSFFEDNHLESYCLDLDHLSELPRLFQKVYDDYDEVSRIFYQVSRDNLMKRKEYTELIKNL